MEIILLASALLGLAFIGLAFNIIFRKKPFPDTHIMRKLGIVCAQTLDKIEQKKAKEKLKFKNVQFIKE